MARPIDLNLSSRFPLHLAGLPYAFPGRPVNRIARLWTFMTRLRQPSLLNRALRPFAEVLRGEGVNPMTVAQFWSLGNDRAG